MRSILTLLFSIAFALPVVSQQPPGVEKPKISLDKMVVGKITDNERGILMLKNIVVTGGACYNGARPTSYSVKVEQLWGEVMNTTTRQTYHLAHLDTEWKSDSVCNVYLGLRGGPLPVQPGTISGPAQLTVQVYIMCLEKFEAFRTKNFDVEISN
jgi:hypothetical protein